MLSFMPSNHALLCNILYLGLPYAGKLTNMQYLYQSIPMAQKSPEYELTIGNRIMQFFQYEPDIDPVLETPVRITFQIGPSTFFDEPSRIVEFQQTHAIVLVIDSSHRQIHANAQLLRRIDSILQLGGSSLDQLPLVIQCNKRDRVDAMSIKTIHQHLRTLDTN